MTQEFSVFIKNIPEDQILEISDLLESNGIKTFINCSYENKPDWFVGNSVSNYIELKIASENFEKAQAVIAENFKTYISDIPENMFELSTIELYEILHKSDEWSRVVVNYAQQVLDLRGEDVDWSRVKAIQEKRLKDLSVPEKTEGYKIFFGYVLTLFFGLLGIIYGQYLRNQKRTLPNGKDIYRFQPNDRANGLFMIVLGILNLMVLTLYYIKQNVS